MEKKITVIPATESFPRIEKVGIYCGISSATGAQLNSLAAQASFLTKYMIFYHILPE